MSKIFGQRKPLSEEDRLTLVKILAKAGYVVSTYPEKIEGKTTSRYVVEYDIKKGEDT